MLPLEKVDYVKARAYFILSVLFLGELACGNIEIQLFEQKRILMGTIVSITIYAVEEPEFWQKHVASALETIKQIEDLTSSYNDSSQIGQINVHAGKDYYQVDKDVLEIIKQAKEISKLSHGAFDITILPLLRMWNFKSSNPRVPTEMEITENLALVGFNNIEIQHNKIRLSQIGMGLDLGGIAKGYAVDRAVEVLKAFGYKDFLVEAGGDLCAVVGDLTKGRRKIWIRHPRQRDKFFANINMDQGAVATSGDYERYFEISDKRYHHILNPKTGYPSAPVVSVTIFSETTFLADAASTAVFVLGPEQGFEFIENNLLIEGLIIFEQGGKLKWKASNKIACKINTIGK